MWGVHCVRGLALSSSLSHPFHLTRYSVAWLRLRDESTASTSYTSSSSSSIDASPRARFLPAPAAGGASGVGAHAAGLLLKKWSIVPADPALDLEAAGLAAPLPPAAACLAAPLPPAAVALAGLAAAAAGASDESLRKANWSSVAAVSGTDGLAFGFGGGRAAADEAAPFLGGGAVACTRSEVRRREEAAAPREPTGGISTKRQARV